MIVDKYGRSFSDGIYNVTNSLANTRNAITNNVQTHSRMDYSEMNNLYKSGVGNKIVRLKAGYALNDTLSFETKADEALYNGRLAALIKKVTKWMLSFGRGIVVFHHIGDDLSRPLGNVNLDNLKISQFSGDMISTDSVVIDIQSDMYMRPEHYIVRGAYIHHSRVVDFRYVEPVELELPVYRYGGISEFELIRDQLIADGIISRSSSNMVEKSSSLFYKVNGFKAAMESKQESGLIEYFTQVENLRSIYGAGILDGDDGVENVTQALSNLAEADQIALRRIAMVTGIALTVLVGESAKGLNSSGENEMQTTWDTISSLQSDYLLEPITKCCNLIGINSVWFSENQGQSPVDKARYDALVIDNAVKLAEIGEDYSAYLNEKGITKAESFDDFFASNDQPGMTIGDLEKLV